MIRSSCDLSVELSVARSSKRQVVRLSGFSEDARLVTDGTGSAGMAGTRHRGRKPKVWSVRISDIRPRILLLQAMNGRFGEAAPQRKNALERQLGADFDHGDRGNTKDGKRSFAALAPNDGKRSEVPVAMTCCRSRGHRVKFA